MEIRQLHKALSSSLAQAAALTDAYAKAANSYRIQVRDYRFGLVNNLDVIEAMTTMQDIKRSLDKAVIQVKTNKALLDIAVS